MRMIPRFLILLGMVALVAACAIIPPPPRTLLISEAKLAQLIASQFPFKGEMLEVLDVNVSHPRISLDPEHNRINTAFDDLAQVFGAGLVALQARKSAGLRPAAIAIHNDGDVDRDFTVVLTRNSRHSR